MLEGKIALVTGAAKGIGRAIALALAADGATVIVNYNGSAQKAEAVVDEIKALGKDSEAYQCNVANTADVDAMIKDVIKRYGSLDILVNNAGITRDNLIMKMSEEDFDAVIDANLKGCFNTIKAVSPSDAQAACRADHQYYLRIRYSWKCRPGKLCSIQGGHHRSYQDHGKRAGKPRYHGQWHCAGLRGYRDDPGAL